MRNVVLYLSLTFIFIFVFGGKIPPTSYAFPKLKFFPKMTVSAINSVTVEGATLGRYLFYDSVLSSDTNMSCASCHKQAFAFSDSPNQFSKGRSGELMKRNTMALFNLPWYPSFFWDGRATSIEAQISHPLNARNEMNMPWRDAIERLNKSKIYKKLFTDAFGNEIIDSVHVSYAIAQFLSTLI